MKPSGNEVFDTNYDYEFAAEQKRNPQKGLVQVMGERALSWTKNVALERAGNWLKGMNEKRKAEKAERKYNGSLQELYAVGDQQQRQETKHAYPVADQPGVYQSSFSGEQPASRVGEHDEVMEGAVSRAKRAIGRLFVREAQEQPGQADVVPQPFSQNPHRDEQGFGDMSQAEEDALFARLRKAYDRPAREDDDRDPPRPEAQEQDDDRLVGTQGK